jgi:uncharacterized membrane protein
MSTWRYAKAGQPCGPVDTAELHSLFSQGTLPRDTLVWKEGMANWAPASTLPDFAASASPPASSPSPQGGTGTSSPAAPPPLSAPAPDAADVDQNKIFAVLAYIGILFLVPLLAAPQSKFARYHANQGVVLFLATVIVCGASFVFTFVPFIGCVVAFVPLLACVAALVLMILGIINAASGQCKPLPLIGHFELIK